MLAQVVFGFAWSLYLLMPKYLTTELQASPEVIGRISAMGGLAGLMTVPLAGRWLDRVGRKPFFRLGCVLIVLLSLGYTQLRSLGPLAYVLQGCISAAFVLAFNAAAALLTDFAPPERLGQAIGWLGSCNVLMNAVATMIAEPLAAASGWRAVFLLGAVAGVGALALSFGLPDSPLTAATTDASAALAEPVALREIAPILITTLVAGAVFVANFSFLQPYAVSLGARAVGSFYVGYTVSAVLARVVFGGLGDRIGRRRVAGCMLLGYGLCALALRDLQPQWLSLYGLSFGVAHGLLYPNLNALLLELLPTARRGLGMVLYNGAFNLGSSTGGLVWGVLAHRHGYGSLYLTASGASLVGTAVLIASRKRHAR